MRTKNSFPKKLFLCFYVTISNNIPTCFHKEYIMFLCKNQKICWYFLSIVDFIPQITPHFYFSQFSYYTTTKYFKTLRLFLYFLFFCHFSCQRTFFLQFFTMNLIFSTTTFFIHLLFPCCSQKLFFSSDKKNPHFPFFNPLTTTIILFLYLSFLVHTFQNYQRNTHFDTFVNKFLIFFPFYTFQKIHQQNLQ